MTVPHGGAYGADSQLIQFYQHPARSADSQPVIMTQGGFAAACLMDSSTKPVHREPVAKLPNRGIFWNFEVMVSGWCLRVEEAIVIGICIRPEHRNIPR